MIVGRAVLGIVEPSTVIDVFAELGVVLILSWVGLDSSGSQPPLRGSF